VTGGVRPDEENISSWMRAGANAVGLGSQLFPKESLEQEEFSGLQQTIENLLGILHAST
jgi:2-dehydro-3-deoxyphosphogluconate aldolase/(4S)-4-hydroxy-2-oxoglutarate aldolase